TWAEVDCNEQGGCHEDSAACRPIRGSLSESHGRRGYGRSRWHVHLAPTRPPVEPERPWRCRSRSRPGTSWLTKTVLSGESATFLAKRMGAIIRAVDSTHVPMLSQPGFVIEVIRAAAKTVREASATSETGTGSTASSKDVSSWRVTCRICPLNVVP